MNNEQIKQLKDEVYHDLRREPVSVNLLIDYLNSRGYLRNPGTPIEAKDIRKGDRIRQVDASSHSVIGAIVSVEYTASVDGGEYWPGDKAYLLSRPKSELPTEPGSVVAVVDGDGTALEWTRGRDGRWRSGQFWTPSDNDMRQSNFEVLA